MDKVHAVVVTYNGRKWVDKCIESLTRSSVPVHITVIDNGSTDYTVRYIRDTFPHVELIETKQNIGFGRANNIGFQQAITNHADFIFLLNQDAWVEYDTIENLIIAQKKDSTFGLISPIHFNGAGDRLDKLFYLYITSQKNNRRKQDNSRDLLSNIILQKNLEYPYSVFFVNAAAWLITKDLLEKVGGFDPLFFHWGEDRNYINRIKFNGIKVGICPKAKIYHDREESLKDRSFFFQEYYYRNKLLCLLDQNRGTTFSDTRKEILRDILRFLFCLNIREMQKAARAYAKLIKNKKEILLRNTIYKQPYCFLEPECMKK